MEGTEVLGAVSSTSSVSLSEYFLFRPRIFLAMNDPEKKLQMSTSYSACTGLIMLSHKSTSISSTL